MRQNTQNRLRGNRLLAALAPADAERLRPNLEEVSLQQYQVLLEPEQRITRAYFPHDGFVSLLTVFEDGSSVETATIGPEGVIGVPLFVSREYSPSKAVVQISGRAATIAAGPLQQAMMESNGLRQVFDCYTHAFLAQVLQTVACNTIHSTEERLAKWLLMSADRMNGDGIPFTHEFLAEMLGVGRPTVSLIARTLQTAGLIQYRRARIAIVDRPGLEEASCSCYHAIRRAYERLLPLTYGTRSKAGDASL
jgi:CRP-like cAMP-binding protein